MCLKCVLGHMKNATNKTITTTATVTTTTTTLSSSSTTTTATTPTAKCWHKFLSTWNRMFAFHDVLASPRHTTLPTHLLSRISILPFFPISKTGLARHTLLQPFRCLYVVVIALPRRNRLELSREKSSIKIGF